MVAGGCPATLADGVGFGAGVTGAADAGVGAEAAGDVAAGTLAGGDGWTPQAATSAPSTVAHRIRLDEGHLRFDRNGEPTPEDARRTGLATGTLLNSRWS